MERADRGKEVSVHEVRVWAAFSASPERWLTNHEVAQLCEGVSERTVRAHTRKLVALGLLEQVEVFPSNRYRLNRRPGKRDAGHALRLQSAARIFAEGK